MLGTGVSMASRWLVRAATMGLFVSGAGLAGYSYYRTQQVAAGTPAEGTVGWFAAFVQEHSTALIVVGVVGMVAGAVLTQWTVRRQTKRMMASMTAGGMPGMSPEMLRAMSMGGMGGGMQAGTMQEASARGGAAADPASPSPSAVPAVKVRCPACKSLQEEAAAFCSACGKPLA